MNLVENRKRTRQRIAGVLAANIGSHDLADEIAFHMTDWMENLEAFVDLCENDRMSDRDIEQMLFVFLAHVPNHLAAARKLIGIGPVEDTFNVGALVEG